MRNANLHHRNDVFDGILAVFLQPFIDDSYETVDIKRHHIFLLRRWYVKTLQNRLEYVAVQRNISVIHPQDG